MRITLPSQAIQKVLPSTTDTMMIWYGQRTAWLLWGNASNTSSNDERSSEKYAVGAHNRFNMTDYDYAFG